MRELVGLARGRAQDNGIDPDTGEPYPEEKAEPTGRPITPADFGPDGQFRPQKDGDS